MNLKQLEAFVKVAETKSFSEAAKQLFLTQPTISAHVSALEKELNTCFLIRNTRGVELSESGKELYAYAVQMLEIEKTIKGRFGKEIKPEGNVLRIGASTVPAQYILPNVMSTFHAEYPGEKLKLFETDSKGVIDMILSHHIDIGFTGTVIEKGNCKYLPFYEDELVVLTPSNEKFVEKLCGGQILADWIMDEPVILREEGSGTKKEAEKMLAELNYDPEIIARVSYLVGHHHTYTNIDGMDYQILVEADFLVNLFEEGFRINGVDKQQVKNVYERIFKTEAGKKICRTMFK